MRRRAPPPSSGTPPGATQPGSAKDASEAAILRRARRRARAEIGFYSHLMSYLGVIALLALINLLTAPLPVVPLAGARLGHRPLLALHGRLRLAHVVRERYFEPAVEREVRREKVVMQTEKQASIDELSATIAHEIRNPIAAAKSLVQQMGEDPQLGRERRVRASVALDELDRVERRISHLLRYAKEEDYTLRAGQPGRASSTRALDPDARQARRRQGARWRATTSAGRRCWPTREKLQQVFANVLDNAIDALEPVAEERRIELFIENGGRTRARCACATTAAASPPEKLERIFNPFFTTKEKGTGLGMAISQEDRRGARGHDRRRQRAGPRHRVRRHPAAAAAEREPMHAADASSSSTTRRRMRLALKGLLAKEGYQVETAGSGEEAVRAIETGSFHVVITDLSMGGVTGMQVLEHARARRPRRSR